MGDPEPLNDYWTAVHEPAAFAREMIEEGIGAVKLWSFDFAAHKLNGSIHITAADVEEGIKPFRTISDAVGNQLELLLDGHGFFQLPVAMRIAEAMC